MSAPADAVPARALGASSDGTGTRAPDRGRERRRDRRLLLGALAVAVVLGGVLAAYATREADPRPPLDAESPTSGGALALFEAARRLGWQPRGEQLPLALLPVTATYAALRFPHGVREADAGRLLAAVRAGAGLVVDVRPEGDPLSDSLGLRLTSGRARALDNRRVATAVGAADALDRPGCVQRAVDASNGTENVSFVLVDSGPARAGTPGLRTFVAVANRPGDGDANADDASDGAAPRVRDPAPVLIGVPLGRGRVVAVADASLFTNGALRTCWAAAGPAVVRALEWVSPAQPGGGRGALVFLQGRRPVAGGPAETPSALAATWRALTEVPAGRTLAQALGAALVLLAALAARAVPPLPVGRAQRRSPREHVGALAHAYREARATRLVARRLVRGLRRRYGGPAFGLGSAAPRGAASRGAAPHAGPPPDDDAQFLAALAARHPAAAADAARLAEATRAPVPPSALAAVGDAAARLDAVLAAARRGA